MKTLALVLALAFAAPLVAHADTANTSNQTVAQKVQNTYTRLSRTPSKLSVFCSNGAWGEIPRPFCWNRPWQGVIDKYEV
jgi:hypothetical protein